MKSNQQLQKADQWWPGPGGAGAGTVRLEWEGTQKNYVWVDGNVLYLDCGGWWLHGVHICQNTSSTFKMGAFYHIILKKVNARERQQKPCAFAGTENPSLKKQ